MTGTGIIDYAPISCLDETFQHWTTSVKLGWDAHRPWMLLQRMSPEKCRSTVLPKVAELMDWRSRAWISGRRQAAEKRAKTVQAVSALFLPLWRRFNVGTVLRETA